MANTFFNRRNVPGAPEGMPRIEVKPIGNWDKTIRTIQQLSPAIKQSSIKAQMKVCKEIMRRVKGHIRNQDLGWKPLSPIYAEQKKESGASGKTLIAYGNYYRSIEVWKKGSQHFVYVGVKKGIYTTSLSNQRSKLEIARIAAIHEFSSGKKIPKRPLWNPTIREMGGAKGIKKMYINSLMWHLRRSGIPVEKLKSII